MTSKTSLRVAVIGPNGQCGSCVVEELLDRGHYVTGISRNPPKKWTHKSAEKYSFVSADLRDTRGFSKVLSDGYDCIVCAYGPPLSDLAAVYHLAVEAHCRIKEALLLSDHKGQFIVIGGAGSLHNKDGVCFADEDDFCYAQWYKWPSQHLNYMYVRARDHGGIGFSRFIWMFWWARENVERPGWFSWFLRPFARLVLRQSKKMLCSNDTHGLITSCRVALKMYEGVRDKKWTFLSPPWLLRDKGIRTGKYESFEDSISNPADRCLTEGIYNEDMAAAIADEVEEPQFTYKHWSCVGPIGLAEW